MADQFMPHQKNPQAISTVALSKNGRYCSVVAANSATGRRNPRTSRRISAQITTAGVFFRPQLRVMAAVCGRLRPGRVPTIPVFLPRAQLPPNPVGRTVAAPA